MNEDLIDALKSIDVSALDYTQWIQVGMAIKDAGLDVSVWDEWSRSDSRYKNGECQRKWDTFSGSATPVTSATIFQMARERGWRGSTFQDSALGWDDVIEYDGNGITYQIPNRMSPAEQFKTYLKALFREDEYVSIVTNDVWKNAEGKWLPCKGSYDRTAGELLSLLERHPDDLGAVIGDWKEECGAWIRFNALDGKGIRNENITRFDYALVESDEMPISEQEALYRKFELPITVLVHSGGKSLHAIVRVNAKDREEYRKRVDFLYDFLEKNGLKIDRQNRNPSRLSRLPGVTRNGVEQTLICTDIGRKSWVEWMDYAEGESDELPSVVSLDFALRNLPDLKKEIIQGVLRQGHKLMMSGPSKAGKSMMLMELAIALSERLKWLRFQCEKSRVLYLNLELDPVSTLHRFHNIYDRLKLHPEHADDIVLWNLRGNALPLDALVPKLVRRMHQQHYDAVIIDPIYKVITGDENSASDMAQFCNLFDKISRETECSVISCHHHSKGAQGAKRAIDRASGSGVFARDTDAYLDIIQLNADANFIEEYAMAPHATCWRMESSLREFPNIKPFNFWYEYPIHRVDESGCLSRLLTDGDPQANLSKSSKRNQTPETRYEDFVKAFEASSDNGVTADVTAVCKYLDIKDRTFRNRLAEFAGEFETAKGLLIRKGGANGKK